MSSSFVDNLLDGQVALVTGGATGIGFAIARQLGAHGASVFLASRQLANLQQACRALEEQGINAAFAVCDVRDEAQVDELMESVLAQFGRLDIVINNAAGNFPAPIEGISANGFRTVVEIDLQGTFQVTRCAFLHALKAQGGCIVNISAPFQQMGVAYQAHVAAAKAGVDSLTRTSAVEFGPYGVRVNAVAPGQVDNTEGNRRFSEALGSVGPGSPLGFVGAGEDIANAVLFLCSPAARYITGQVLVVDGGACSDMLKLPRATTA